MKKLMTILALAMIFSPCVHAVKFYEEKNKCKKNSHISNKQNLHISNKQKKRNQLKKLSLQKTIEAQGIENLKKNHNEIQIDLKQIKNNRITIQRKQTNRLIQKLVRTPASSDQISLLPTSSKTPKKDNKNNNESFKLNKKAISKYQQQ